MSSVSNVGDRRRPPPGAATRGDGRPRIISTGQMRKRRKIMPSFSHVDRTQAAHAVIGHASLNFPGWERHVDRAADLRVLVSAEKRPPAGDHLTQDALDRHVSAFAMRALAAALRGARAFRIMLIPRGDVERSRYDNPILTGLSKEFQRWVESCGVATHVRPFDCSAFPRLALYAEFQ